jgi:hypothetical protein
VPQAWDRSDQVVAAVALAAVALHLFRVDSAPPGFFDDEAAIAAPAICVAQSGHELFGARLTRQPTPTARATLRGPWFQSDVVKAGAQGDPLPADYPRPARDHHDLASGRARCRADVPP